MSVSTSEGERLLQKATNWSPWVYLKLDWGQLSNNRLPILLTVNFDKHHLQVLGRNVIFGLRSGELKLIPLNAIIPYEFRWPKQELKESINVKRATIQENAHTQKKSTAINSKSDIKEANITIDYGANVNKENQLKISIKDEFECTLYQVSTKGSEKIAYWNFEANNGDFCLHGNLIKKELCSLVLSKKFCRIQYKFEVSPKDILPLKGLEWPWPEDISGSKQLILIAFLRKAFIDKNSLVPYESELWYRSKPDEG